ncbi:MAG: hypothetical protein AAB900_00705 [Patescibacteria group bacterium]
MKKCLVLLSVLALGGCVTIPPMYPGVSLTETNILATRQNLASQPAPAGMTEREALEWTREARQLENDRARNQLYRQQQAQRSVDNYRRDRAYRQAQEDRAEAEKLRQQQRNLQTVSQGVQNLARQWQANRPSQPVARGSRHK